jgi:thymidylate synthase (FAD)
MTEQVKVLDYGYVQLIDTWGRLSVEDAAGDAALVAAARMSTGKGFLGWGGTENCPSCSSAFLPHYVDASTMKCIACGGTGKRSGDEKLLAFLYANKHMTPFEMGGATFEVMAPIFVFREWHRHRTQSYNEMSARYAPLPDVNYVPSVERLMINAGSTNKQAGTVKDAVELTPETAEAFRKYLKRQYEDSEKFYQEALSAGIPKELARVAMPVGRYSRMRASANLRNWLGFLTLRNDKNAQWEIRQYAQVVQTILGGIFPRTVALFMEGKTG